MHSHTRTVTFSQGVALYMGAVLGSGILILPGYTAEVAGPASVLSWVLLSLASIPLADTFARLALQYNNFGGIATIVQHAFGTLWSALVGWFYFVWVATGQAVVGLTGAGYLVAVFGLSEAAYYGIALLFMLGCLITNWFGMKASGLLSLALSGVVLFLLVATIAFAFPHLQSNQFEPFAPHGVGGIGQACVLIFWAFFGWESITHLVPEFRNPQRDVMRCTWVSVALIGVVYTLLSIVTVGTGTYGEEGTIAPLAALMSSSMGFTAGFATAVIACIVCLGTLNVYAASSSRLGYALAQEGKFPSWFGGLSRRGVPHRSMLFLFGTNALTLTVCYLFTIPVGQLILVPTTLGIFVYIIASFACVKLLWKHRIGRWSSLAAAAFTLIVAPFSSGYLIVPVLVAAACWLYLKRKGSI
jgi:amino acid efflux transporter